jgi:hypothetical protein
VKKTCIRAFLSTTEYWVPEIIEKTGGEYSHIQKYEWTVCGLKKLQSFVEEVLWKGSNATPLVQTSEALILHANLRISQFIQKHSSNCQLTMAVYGQHIHAGNTTAASTQHVNGSWEEGKSKKDCGASSFRRRFTWGSAVIKW